jgi:hypothetical protein
MGAIPLTALVRQNIYNVWLSLINSIYRHWAAPARSLVRPSSRISVHSSLQKRHQVRSARVRRHTVFDNLAPLAENSADILVPPCRQTPAQCGSFDNTRLKCHVPVAHAMRGAL